MISALSEGRAPESPRGSIVWPSPEANPPLEVEICAPLTVEQPKTVWSTFDRTRTARALARPEDETETPHNAPSVTDTAPTTLFMHCARAQHSRGETSHHLKRLKALALPFRRARWSPHGPLTTVPACLSCSLYIAVLGRKHSKAPGNAEHSSLGRRALVLERRHAG